MMQDEADEGNGGGDYGGHSELFLSQILMSETLRENNKYWCEECVRLNEAQRSVEYDALPRIMVLQLKRFTATTTSSSGRSSLSSGSYNMHKITDHIPTPFVLDCFCRHCRQPPDGRKGKQHHYRLYAVIMHLGSTLLSGHYIAYVRASSEVASDFSQCQRAAAEVAAAIAARGKREGEVATAAVATNGFSERQTIKKKEKGILKFLRRKDESKSTTNLPNGVAASLVNGGGGGNGNEYDLQPLVPRPEECASVHCCGIRAASLLAGCGQQGGCISPESASGRSLEDSDALVNGHTIGQAADEDVWLECDDETITSMTRRHFESSVLASTKGSSTPYLLFYQKC